MRIALLDDDPVESQLIQKVLLANGHEVFLYEKPDDFLRGMVPDKFELLVIAITPLVPDIAGLLRSTGQTPPFSIPVLLIGGQDCEEIIVATIQDGTSDYLLRPVRRAEVAIRTAVLLRRAYPDRRPERAEFGRYAFETSTGRTYLADKPIALTRKEFDLALLFFRHLGRPLSRATIQESIWPHEGELPSRTMDTHVSRVRSKLRLHPANGYQLTPVYSFGYRLTHLPEEPASDGSASQARQKN